MLIKDGGYVTLQGERLSIRARIHVISGYSAHADQREIIHWVQSMPKMPERIRLVHGDPPAREALAGKLQGLGYTVEGQDV